MSDTSQGPGWWLASDGRWYPPESHPNAAPPPPPPAPPTRNRRTTSNRFRPLHKSTALWTQGAMWVAAASQGILAIFAFRYWQTFGDWFERDTKTWNDALSAESNFNLASGFSWLVWVAGFIFLIVWLANVHTSTTSLLADDQDRKYTRGWSIGVWFIPFANVISTPQVIAENFKIASAPRKNNKVDNSWKTLPVNGELVWWWILVVGGMLTSSVGGQIAIEGVTSSEILGGLTAVMIGSTAATIGLALGAVVITDMNKELTTVQ